MRIRRCPCWLLAALCIAVTGTGADSLLAQSSVPAEILNAQTELNSSQKQTIDAYVDAQVTRLQSSNPEQVAKGRADLAEPFGLSQSPHFLKYYAQSIAQRVSPLLDPNEPLITRLNVAIVSAKLSGDNLIVILQAGANDPSPAVRYWIAKAVGTAAKADAFQTEQQQRAVLKVLDGRLKAEEASLVLEQVLVAIAEIDLDDAIQTVLAGLDSRVKFHLNNPNDRYKPVMGGTQQLYRKLVEQLSAGINKRSDLYELARIAYRYYALIGQQLDDMQNNPPVDEDLKRDKAVMAKLCQDVMTYAVRNIAQQTAPQPIDTTSAAQIKASAGLWKDILKGPPFNFNDAQLAIEQPEE